MHRCLSLYSSCIGAISTTASSFGPGNGTITLGSIACTGAEGGLLDCPTGSVSGCTHLRDAGVRCITRTCMYIIGLP